MALPPPSPDRHRPRTAGGSAAARAVRAREHALLLAAVEERLASSRERLAMTWNLLHTGAPVDSLSRR